MDLLIEDGILLKRYHLPWRPEGWGFPAGWTPDRLDARILYTAYKLFVGTHSAAAREEAEQTFEREYRTNPQLLKRPWPGWIPVGLGDKDLQRAYRELFRVLNADLISSAEGTMARRKWPPDGRYEYVNGRILNSVSL